MRLKQGLGPLKPGQKHGAEKWCAGLAALGAFCPAKGLLVGVGAAVKLLRFILKQMKTKAGKLVPALGFNFYACGSAVGSTASSGILRAMAMGVCWSD